MPLLRARQLALAAVERLEDLAEVARRHARAVIAHGDARRAAVAPAAQRDRASATRRRAYLTALSTRLQSTCTSASRSKRTGGSSASTSTRSVESLPFDVRPQELGHLAHDRRDGDPTTSATSRVALLQARELEHVVDEPAQALRLDA